MKRTLLVLLALTTAALAADTPPAPPSPAAPAIAPVSLPAPQKTGGIGILDALARRATARAFAPRELPAPVLSDLLWAACGVNRSDGKRTAPTARDRREIDVYVLMPRGAFVYDATGHALVPVVAEDVRALGGQQPFVANAPVTLVYVADLAKMGSGSPEDKKPVAYIDTGYVSQNVYLYSASTGLVTGARMMIDRPALAAKLRLRPDQLIVLAQSVGYPAEAAAATKGR